MSSSIENLHVFLVLGASGGIGSQVARQLRSAGHHVLLASRKSDRLDRLASDLGAPKWELDPANSWVTGEEFAIDGGLGRVRLNAQPVAK